MKPCILLYVYGKLAYAYMAFNLAMSIRYANIDATIKFCASENIYSRLPEGFLAYFDKTAVISESHLFHNRWAGLDYCYAKLNMFNYFEPGTVNIFMDADSLVNNAHGFNSFVDEARRCGLIFGSYLYTNRDEILDWGCHIGSYWRFFKFEPYNIYAKAVSSYIMGFAEDFKPSSIIPLYLTFLENRECYANWLGGVPDELIWEIYCNTVHPYVMSEEFHRNRIHQRIYSEGVFFAVPPYKYNKDELFSYFFLTSSGDFPKVFRSIMDARIYGISQAMGMPFGCLYHKKSDFSLLEGYYEGRGRVIQDFYEKRGGWK